MTRPATSSLVLDGEAIKARLQADRFYSKTSVHVDWLRFTIQKRNAPFPQVEHCFPEPVSIWDEGYRLHKLVKNLHDLPDPDWAVSAQALDLAAKLVSILGPGYTVAPELRKGHDFYRHRYSIEREGVECGWVGFLASGDSPRQKAQASTIHANLYGVACTFAQHGWRDSMADLIDELNGDITRADLALDFFTGIPGGMNRVWDDYKNGLCDVGGKRPKTSQAGDWLNGHERSFYLGSREAGKQTNVYEKGDQLFGVHAGSTWVRAELRYGNKLRVLSTEILRRPADFFAGASSWHSALLRDAEADFTPEPIRTTSRLAAQTVLAEVTRNVRWALTTAAPTIAAAFQHMGNDFLALVENQKLPGRLRKFSPSELAAAFTRITINPVEGVVPAFATP